MAEIVLLGRYEYKECNDCGHRYDLRNSKGQSVTKEEWDQLRQKSMERLAGGEAEERRAQSRRMEQYRQEAQEMKKSKKAAKCAKGAKDAGKKKAKKVKESAPKGPSLVKVLYDFMSEHPGCTSEDVAAAGKKAFPKREMNLRSIAWYRSMWSRGERLPKGATKALPCAKPKKAAEAKAEKS